MTGLTRKDIEDVLRLIDNSAFDELKLEMGDLKLELRRRGAAPSTSPLEPAAPAAAQAATAPVVTHAPAAPAQTVAASGGGTAVPSPLLGTFYHAPKPGAEAFVKVGDIVTPDTVIGIIEVMKLMNSVAAGMAGTVTEIVAENGTLVEHGQTLIRVRQD